MSTQRSTFGFRVKGLGCSMKILKEFYRNLSPLQRGMKNLLSQGMFLLLGNGGLFVVVEF